MGFEGGKKSGGYHTLNVSHTSHHFIKRSITSYQNHSLKNMQCDSAAALLCCPAPALGTALSARNWADSRLQRSNGKARGKATGKGKATGVNSRKER